MKKKELKQEIERIQKEKKEMLQDMKDIIFKDCIYSKMKWAMIIQMNEKTERFLLSVDVMENKNFDGFQRFFNDNFLEYDTKRKTN
jgi:hypothetical protein